MARWHRWNAFALSAFLALHLINHAIGAFGISYHLDAMQIARQVYRLPGIEHIVIVLFTIQVFLGLRLVFLRGWPHGGWAWAQVASGLYLAFFLIQHVPSILVARSGASGLDTNSYFAAAVLDAAPFIWYFAPYYTLAIAALFTHVACAIRFAIWPRPAPIALYLICGLGLILGAAVVVALAGITQPFELPAQYQSYLEMFI
ncbi:MAG: hypothetical protein ACPGRD_01695 [Planktomarina sp.]